MLMFKDLGMKFCRPTGEILLDSRLIKRAITQGVQLNKVKVFQAYYYSDNEFEEFYRKHVLKISRKADEFTVLVKEESDIPTKDECVKIIEEVIQSEFEVTLRFGAAYIKVKIPNHMFQQKFYVRTFDPLNNMFVTPPIEGFLRLENVVTIKSINLSYAEKQIFENFRKNNNTLPEIKMVEHVIVMD